MGMEFWNCQMEINIKDNGKMEKNTEQACIQNKINLKGRENGRREYA